MHRVSMGGECSFLSQWQPLLMFLSFLLLVYLFNYVLNNWCFCLMHYTYINYRTSYRSTSCSYFLQLYGHTYNNFTEDRYVILFTSWFQLSVKRLRRAEGPKVLVLDKCKYNEWEVKNVEVQSNQFWGSTSSSSFVFSERVWQGHSTTFQLGK